MSLGGFVVGVELECLFEVTGGFFEASGVDTRDAKVDMREDEIGSQANGGFEVGSGGFEVSLEAEFHTEQVMGFEVIGLEIDRLAEGLDDIVAASECSQRVGHEAEHAGVVWGAGVEVLEDAE